MLYIQHFGRRQQNPFYEETMWTVETLINVWDSGTSCEVGPYELISHNYKALKAVK